MVPRQKPKLMSTSTPWSTWSVLATSSKPQTLSSPYGKAARTLPLPYRTPYTASPASKNRQPALQTVHPPASDTNRYNGAQTLSTAYVRPGRPHQSPSGHGQCSNQSPGSNRSRNAGGCTPANIPSSGHRAWWHFSGTKP